MFYFNDSIYLNDSNSAGAWQNIVPKRFNMRSLLLLVAVIAMPAHSITIDEYYHDIFACDNCNLQGLIINAGVEDATVNVLAVDRVQATWQSYEIFTDLVGENGQPMIGSLTITPVPTPAEFVAEIQDAMNVVKDFKTYSVMTVPIGDLPLPPMGDSENHDSALDLIGREITTRNFENAVSDLQTSRVFGGVAVGAALTLIKKLLADATGLVTVTFADGSSMEFELENMFFDQSDFRFKLKFKRVEGSGRDSEGRSIPEEADDLDNEAFFFESPGGGPGLGEFVDLAGRLGVNINGLPAGGLGGSSCAIEMSCSFDSSGQMNCIASVSGC